MRRFFIAMSHPQAALEAATQVSAGWGLPHRDDAGGFCLVG
jgi:hypothetical protein